ncbi:MAG TPA: hypothetical protein VM869_09125 [Enhygromyxa sp.]|nr:hypothetical protein [Enhygromyxa sp.]
MAGPSGADAVQAYIRSSKSAAGSRRREYLTALRRELAKHGRDPNLVEFDCFFLCVSCGCLSEPRSGDPMRREGHEVPRACAMCGENVTDLRHTEMVESLLSLEQTDVAPRRLRWLGKIFGMLGVVGVLGGLLATYGPREVALTLGVGPHDEWRWVVLPVMLVSTLVAWISFARHVPGSSLPPRTLPRRWRMPRTSKRPGAQPHRRVRNQAETSAELLRAPLSGRPCIAYEVAVRDDDDPNGKLASWRLLEQDNVRFRVGELAVEPGEALLQLRREPFHRGTIGSMDPAARRTLRMRGLLDSEAVHVYETILVAGDACEVSRRKADAPVLVVSSR